ncbi:hypothetical protein ES703_122602 [subsurface metagenome]
MPEKEISLREFARRVTQSLKSRAKGMTRRRDRLHGIIDAGNQRKKARHPKPEEEPQGRGLESGAGGEEDLEYLAEEIKGARGYGSGAARRLRTTDGGGPIIISEDTQSRLLDLIDWKKKKQQAGM